MIIVEIKYRYSFKSDQDYIKFIGEGLDAKLIHASDAVESQHKKKPIKRSLDHHIADSFKVTVNYQEMDLIKNVQA